MNMDRSVPQGILLRLNNFAVCVPYNEIFKIGLGISRMGKGK